MTKPDSLLSDAIGVTLFSLVMVALFVGLGVWQLQRRVEKHALIAELTTRLAASPVPLPAPAQWPALTPAHDEFRRVTFTATYRHLPDAMVYSAGSGVRPDVSGPGTWAFLPAQLASGQTVVIDAGFVPNMMQDRSVENRAVAPLATGRPVTMTGYLRFPEKSGMFTLADDAAKRLWYTRDHLSMARALGWGQGHEVAPFYVDLETPVPENGIPKPGPLQVDLPDNHMQYAITWFGLASIVVIGFSVWMRRRRPL
jgi:cytochrome oxidase assembly protein ShyY1